MSEAQAMPLMFTAVIICVLIIRSREVPWWIGAIFFLAGFFTAYTAAGLYLENLVIWTQGVMAGR
jgi:quinol-cytochrome oxidoreductase complex cytochrome b subunit